MFKDTVSLQLLRHGEYLENKPKLHSMVNTPLTSSYVIEGLIRQNGCCDCSNGVYFNPLLLSIFTLNIY